MSETLEDYVKKIKKLPTIPVVANQILGLVNDDLVSVDKIEKIIENDPAISAKILSVANSAYFGSREQTKTLGNAVMRIGFNNVKNIALGISLMTMLSNGKSGNVMDYQRVFNHSVTVGFIAGLLCKHLKNDYAEEILMNGILHDMGYLVMNKYFSEEYSEVLNMFEKKGSLIDAEKEVLKFTHADIGTWLAEQWNLPHSVTDTTLYHHAPSLAKRSRKRTAIVHIADFMTTKNILRPTKNDPNYPFDNASLEILGISEGDLKELEEKIGGDAFTDEVFNKE